MTAVIEARRLLRYLAAMANETPTILPAQAHVLAGSSARRSTASRAAPGADDRRRAEVIV
jgi:hypothetical protein